MDFKSRKEVSMEDLAPPLRLILFLRYGLEKGDSFKTSVKLYLNEEKNCDWAQLVRQWILLKEQNRSTNDVLKPIKSSYRRELFFLMDKGWRGEPIYQLLCQLEEETLEACEDEINEFMLTLPVKSLAPLLLFQFPAFLILLMAPLLSALLHS